MAVLCCFSSRSHKAVVWLRKSGVHSDTEEQTRRNSCCMLQRRDRHDEHLSLRSRSQAEAQAKARLQQGDVFRLTGGELLRREGKPPVKSSGRSSSAMAIVRAADAFALARMRSSWRECALGLQQQHRSQSVGFGRV